MLWFFSLMTKNIDQDQKNGRWSSRDPKDVLMLAATVIILVVADNERNLMPSHFFPQSLRVNAADNKELLENGLIRDHDLRKTIHLSTSLIRSIQHKNG